MSHIFIELWSIKDSWRQLGEGGRAAYVAQLGPAIQSMVDNGLEIIAWGYNDPAIERRVGYDVWAVYRLADRAMLDQLQAAIAGSGWYDYFDHANAGGAALAPQDILRDHVTLTPAPAAE